VPYQIAEDVGVLAVIVLEGRLGDIVVAPLLGVVVVLAIPSAGQR
jgi:hypothetical protein